MKVTLAAFAATAALAIPATAGASIYDVTFQGTPGPGCMSLKGYIAQIKGSQTDPASTIARNPGNVVASENAQFPFADQTLSVETRQAACF